MLETDKEDYYKDYGFSPIIEASLHYGSVICAEMGEIKTQIVFQGDTMNTTSRILDKCKEFNSGLVVSDAIIKRLSEIKSNDYHYKGEIVLKGKQKPLALFSFKN